MIDIFIYEDANELPLKCHCCALDTRQPPVSRAALITARWPHATAPAAAAAAVALEG